MSDVQKHTVAGEFVLPPSMVSKLDISRLANEVEQVDNDLTEAALRAKTNGGEVPKPVVSEQLSAFLEKNGQTLDNAGERTELIKQLRELKENVPVLHMTFAVPADGESLQQLADWVRNSVHPQAVIEVGLQPALVAGVYLRTTNHVHDFSVRGALKARHGALVEELGALRGAR